MVVRNTKRLHLLNHAFHINFFVSLKCDKNHENAFRFLKNFPGEKPPDPRSGAVRFAHMRITDRRPFRFLAFLQGRKKNLKFLSHDFKLNPALLLLILPVIKLKPYFLIKNEKLMRIFGGWGCENFIKFAKWCDEAKRLRTPGLEGKPPGWHTIFF